MGRGLKKRQITGSRGAGGCSLPSPIPASTPGGGGGATLTMAGTHPPRGRVGVVGAPLTRGGGLPA